MKKLNITLPIIFVLILINIVIFSYALTTITVDEKDFVNLEVTAVDEDGDPIYFNFSEPLDEYGQWQTTYGDYGEYDIEIYVSDGNTTTTEHVLLIVNKVNWPPVLEPIEDITIKEADTLILKPKITDEENDILTIIISEPVGDDGVWETDYDSAGEYKINVSVSDWEHEVSQEFTLTVTDVNRAPELESYYPEEDFTINEGEQISLSVSGIDLDGDSITYLWILDGKEVSENKDYTYRPNFNSAGLHDIRASVSDGYKRRVIIWKAEVLNVNRAPEFKVVDKISMNESDYLILEFEAVDPDGDEVEYTIADPIGDDGEWQTDYDSAGTYYIDVEVTDGDLTTSKTIELTVNDVDRAPLFERIYDLEIDEGETKTIELKALDEDEDYVVFSAENLPEGASLEGDIFTYTPPYYTILKPEGILQNALKGAHLDEYYYKKEKEFIVTFTAAGKDLTTTQDVKITVEDVNLPPEMDAIDNIMVNEGELIEVIPSASDPDNDDIKVTFSEPLDSNGKWQTGYDNAGIYTATATVSDGKEEISQEIMIMVNDVNRAPVFEEMDDFQAREDELISIRPDVTDPDGHAVFVSAENLPEGAVFINGEIMWKPDYDFCSGQDREVIATFVATDELDLATSQDIKIIVKNSNRKPIIFEPKPESSIIAFTGSPILFEAKVLDIDNDKLSFEWEFGGFNKVTNATPRLKRTFTTPGDKTVTLKISDGFDIVQKTWRIKVVERKLAAPSPATTTTAEDSQTSSTSPQPVSTTTSSSAGSPKTITYVIDN